MHLVKKALIGRPNCSKAVWLLLGSALLAASVAGVRADVIELLQGAWVMEDTACTAVFEKIGGKIQFKSRTFAPEPGFIISGSIGRGPTGECKISVGNEENDRFSALLSCYDALMSKKMTMTFRIIDDTHFERVEPNFTIRHKKCSL